jgi:hypothetical protein
MKFSTSAVTVALAALTATQSSNAFAPASFVNPSSTSKVSSSKHHPFGIVKPLKSTTVDVDATTDDATAETYE